MERAAPFDLNAERATLGSVLLDPETILVIRNIVSCSDFHLEKHSFIYEAMLECVHQRVPPALTSVATELRKQPYGDSTRLDACGGVLYLNELTEATPTAVYADHYARTVASLGARRRLIELGGKIAAAGYDERSSLELLHQQISEELSLERRIAVGRQEWRKYTKDGVARWGETYEVVPFTIDPFLPPGTFMLAGKPKTRKSWFALNCCYAVAHGGKALGYFPARQGEALYIDLEMGDRRIYKRLRTIYPDAPPPRGVTFATEWPKVGEGFEDWLESYIEAHPFVRLVVVDTLVAIRPRRGRNEDPYEADKAFTQRLTNLTNKHGGLTLLLIHHSRKMVGDDAIDDGSGTLGLAGGCDNFGSLCLVPDKRNTGILKLRGRDIEKDDDIDLAWDPRLVQWNYKESTRAELTPERQKIVNLLTKRAGLTAKEIATILNRPEPGTRRLLSDMLADHLVQNAQGVWFVSEDAVTDY